MLTNNEIVKFLRSKATNAGFIDRLKIQYRPFICPFGILLDLAESKNSAFDIGCGSGQFCMLLENFTGVSKICGIEISERLVKNAQELSPANSKKELTFLSFNGKAIPDSIANYEIVYLIDVFHHVPRKQQTDFVQEIYKKMSKGSVLIFKDINKASPLVVFNKMHDLVFAGEIGHEMSFKKASELLSTTGFKIEKEFKKRVFVYPHYFILARK